MLALANPAAAALTMSSKDIADLTGKRHDNVMRDVRAMLAELHGEEGVLSFEDTLPNPQNGQSYPIFRLPKRECLVLVAGYSATLRARIIDRWLALEASAAPAALDLRDPRQLAPLTLQLAHLVHEQQAQLEAAQPKVEFFEAVATADNAQPLREVARVLKIGERKLRDFLKSDGIYMRHAPLPLQEHIDAGRFTVIERSFDSGDFKKNYAVTLVTGRGIQYLQRRLAEAGLR